MDDCSPRRCQHPAEIYYFQKFYPFENFQCLEMKTVMIISIKDTNQQSYIWVLGSIHQLYQFDNYDYYDLPLTLNLSYFPVSFPESSTRDPYLGETLLWNEKSWIIFRLGHYFNRFRLICDFGKHLAPEGSNVRRWMCTRSGLEKGQRKKDCEIGEVL